MIPYLAGFFDGEGCITIGNNGSVCLSVVNTSEPVLHKFVEFLGGKVRPRKQKVNKPQFEWRTYGPEAVLAAKELLPHLLEKKDQAEVVIHWLEIERPQFKTGRLANTRGQFKDPNREIAIKEYQTKLTQQKLGIYIDN